MKISLAHLGPTGTNSETAALAYADWLAKNRQQEAILCPYPSLTLVLRSVATKEIDLAIVPIENSIGGSVTVVLDILWQSPNLQIHQGLTLPIYHGLLSYSSSLESIKTVYSHSQALAQCEKWLEKFLPQAQLVANSSTTEALKFLKDDLEAAAIASPHAAKLYNVPLLKEDIKDRPDNCTRFWILSSTPKDSYDGSHLSLAFSLPQNKPGALVNALQIFARREINLSKIESRPTKRSLGEYIFFIDVEGNSGNREVKAALSELSFHTEELKIFGNYDLLPIPQ
ncbi:MAG: prephenate dehydratase [Pleurocapsa sp.]